MEPSGDVALVVPPSGGSGGGDGGGGGGGGGGGVGLKDISRDFSEEAVLSDSSTEPRTFIKKKSNSNDGGDGNQTAIVGKWQSLSVSRIPGNEPLSKDQGATKEGRGVATTESHVSKEGVDVRLQPSPARSHDNTTKKKLDSILMPPPSLPHGLRGQNKSKALLYTSKTGKCLVCRMPHFLEYIVY